MSYSYLEIDQYKKNKESQEKKIQEEKNTALREQKLREQSERELLKQKEHKEFNEALQSLRMSIQRKLSATLANNLLKENQLLEKTGKIFPKASSQRRHELIMILKWADNTINGRESDEGIMDCVLKEKENESVLDEQLYRIMIGIGLVALGIGLGIGVGLLGYYFVFPISAVSLANGLYAGLYLLFTLGLFPIGSIAAGINCFNHEPSLGREVRQLNTFFQSEASNTPITFSDKESSNTEDIEMKKQGLEGPKTI